MDVIDAGDAIRATHLAASLLPAGLYLFMLAVAHPTAARSAEAGVIPAELRRWVVQVLRWCMPVAFVSGVLWLCLEAVAMSGEPLRAALTPAVLGTVLRSTLFGHLWIGRAALLALLSAWVFRPINQQKRGYSDAIGLLLAGAFALTLAWVGHAAGMEGIEGDALLGSQIAHLAAAAGWLGGLPPLGVSLALSRNRPNTLAFAAAATRRFSPLGMICVTVLVLSGIVNSWVLVGTIPKLLGTAYGQTLLIKLAFVAGMLMLAAINRFVLTPGFGTEPRRVLRALENSVTLETALGIGVLIAVGALGATMPAAHDQPLWPLSFTLSLEPVLGGHPDPQFVIAAAVAVVGLIALIVGAYYRSRIVAGVGVLAALGSANFIVEAMAVPAYPTTFMASPVGFTADAIARGARIYAANCVACHGETGKGDGPEAAGLPRGEATLVGHLLEHPEGELFWFIGDGVPDTPMPGFSGEVAPEPRWALIQYLRAQAQATAAAAMTAQVMPNVGAPAPDFSFEIGHRPPQTLADQRSKTAVLLVFYSRPKSDARLAQLAAVARTLRNVRIVAVPLNASDATGDHPDEADLLAQPAPEVVAAYGLYGWRIGPAGPQSPQHTELLIDRAGNVRARWHLTDADGWADLGRLKAAVDSVARVPFRSMEPMHHGHG